MSRPRVSVFIATSLDGFIARTDGGLDWLDIVQRPGEDYGYAAFMAEVDALVIGRGTYDTAIGFAAWPYDGKRVGVFTHRPLTEPRVEALEGELAPHLARLSAAGIRRVYLDGGQLVRQGLREGVVDDLTLGVVPQLLGSGRPLFGEGVAAGSWVLSGSQAYPSGLVQLRYRRP
jgi:dihydrofolate reductase